MDRATFYAALRRGTLFDHGLSQRQVTGMEAILDAWGASGYTDERWLAYAFGTAYHETGRAMYPVPEGGKGKGHPYGTPANAAGQAPYGRGFVQLTWATNYARADKELGLGGKLVADYDLALDPNISAQVLLRGMAEAWFTAFKLGDYLNDHLADYLHARRIVNGMDHAADIAGYALTFYAAIQAATHKASDTTAAAPAPTPAQPAPPLTDIPILGDLAKAAASATGAVVSTILPGGPSPAAPAPIPATAESIAMNPMTAIAIIEQVMTYAPTIEHIITEVPDIVAKGEDAIKRFEAVDLQGALTDIEAIVADLGISQNMLSQIITRATSSAPPVAKAA